MEPPAVRGQGKGWWSVLRKMTVVLELLRGGTGGDQPQVGVTAATLSRWREAFLEGGKRQSQEIDSKHIVLSPPVA